ncbi:MAG: glycosyltransferase family 4 protein, partial [Saprospiraceae bacterium]
MNSEVLLLTVAAVCSFLITYVTIPSVINLAYQKKLLDIPNQRKVHTQQIPSLGGIGIFVGVLISFTLFCSLESFEAYKYILTSYLILFFMGVKDDLLPMAAHRKFFIQVLVAGLIYFGGVRITSLHGLFGIEEIHIVLSYIVTIFFIVGVTNAYNLIDGVDGLAGGLGGIGCATLGFLLLWVGEYNFATLAFAITGSLIAFLRFNFGKYPKKIFMGDGGSLLLGMTITILSIQFIESPNT